MSSAFGKRKKNDGIDFYPTEPLFTEILCEEEKFSGLIWEPACGDGAISKVLDQYGYKVLSTDKYKHGFGKKLDFLTQYYGPVDNIVTNPPSCLFDDFLTQALSVSNRKVAFLFGSFILSSSKSRYEKFFKENPPAKVIIILNRMKVFGESSQFAHCWAIWDKSKTKKSTKLKWVLK